MRHYYYVVCSAENPPSEHLRVISVRNLTATLGFERHAGEGTLHLCRSAYDQRCTAGETPIAKPPDQASFFTFVTKEFRVRYGWATSGALGPSLRNFRETPASNLEQSTDRTKLDTNQ